MIEVRGLCRSYGSFEAVRDVSFSIAEGEIVGMLGPNGAGKTTTLRMITGFLPPTRGEVLVAGRSLEREPIAARREIGYLPESVALYGEMRVRELLAYRARLVGLHGAAARRRVEECVERCLLGEARDQVIATLSKGYRQRVGLAAALLSDPSVLVLDEPTVGLDPAQIVAVRELIRELGRRRTVLLSTHVLTEVELLCQRVLILDRGRIVAEGEPEALSRRWSDAARCFATFARGPEPEDVAAALQRLPGVRAVTPREGDAGEIRFELEAEAGTDLRGGVFETAVACGFVLLGLERSAVSLEDVFVRLTRDGEEDGEATSAQADAPEPRP